MGRNPDLEYKTFKFDVAAASLKQDAPKGIVDGYAAVFHNIDHQGDVIAPGAFSRSLEERGANIDVFIGHNWQGLPVGYPLALREDEHGLWTSTQLFQTGDGADVLAVVEGLARSPNGKRLGMSIGFEIRSADFEERDGQQIRVLNDIELFEYSFVSMPANELARVTAAKDRVTPGASVGEDGEQIVTVTGKDDAELRSRLLWVADRLNERMKADPTYRIRAARLELAHAGPQEEG